MLKLLDYAVYLLGTVTLLALLAGIITALVDSAYTKFKNRRNPKLNIARINKLICQVRRQGYAVKAKGKYLVLEDVLKVELSDKKID